MSKLSLWILNETKGHILTFNGILFNIVIRYEYVE